MCSSFAIVSCSDEGRFEDSPIGRGYPKMMTLEICPPSVDMRKETPIQGNPPPSFWKILVGPLCTSLRRKEPPPPFDLRVSANKGGGVPCAIPLIASFLVGSSTFIMRFVHNSKFRSEITNLHSEIIRINVRWIAKVTTNVKWIANIAINVKWIAKMAINVKWIAKVPINVQRIANCQ